MTWCVVLTCSWESVACFAADLSVFPSPGCRQQAAAAAAGGGELVDSEPQWREVQRLQAERLRPSGYQNSGMETETELSYQPKRRVKRHRSEGQTAQARRSNGRGVKWLRSEGQTGVKQHRSGGQTAQIRPPCNYSRITSHASLMAIRLKKHL